MAALKNDVKLFIVQALACFDTPLQVQIAVKQEFKMSVSFQQLNSYNPATVAGSRMSDKLKTIFDETRKRFLENVSDIPIANQTYRLRGLNRLYEQASSRGNPALAAQLLEQASKEVGGAFTNKQKLEHAGADGGPVNMNLTVSFVKPGGS